MVIELRGVEFHNKGAELMLWAIVEKIKKEIPHATFVMETKRNVTIKDLRSAGFCTKINYHQYRINAAKWASILPKSITRTFGFILEKHIDVVLDGSGFAFGDYWGDGKAKSRLSNHVERWQRTNKKIILLPQAFGPFEEPELRNSMLKIIENCNLIFARDPYSFTYLKDLKHKSNIHIKPDFTNLIKGTAPKYFTNQHLQVAIIPNSKLIQTNVFDSITNYVAVLNKMAELIVQCGKVPFFLIHEGLNDLSLAVNVNTTFGKSIPIITEKNPLCIKGIIGACDAVITSRFHGLVSALSQAIPTLCIGWSHKYQALMDEYDHSEGLLKNEDLNDSGLREKITLLLEKEAQTQVKTKLMKASIKQKELSESMWKMVFEVLKS